MKVLLAEDSLTMRRMLAVQLKGWNYDVTEAEDGDQAWQHFQQNSYSLVLTDWMMPGIDGLELIRRIRAANRSEYVYVVLLTSRSDKEDLVAAMEAGADDFLGKPCNPKELRVRLHAGERILDLERTLIEKNNQLMDAQAALVQSEKLVGVGQLAAGMAHEINNPISFVANNLAVLQRDVQALMSLVEEYSDCVPVLEQIETELAAKIQAAEKSCDLPWLQENLPQLFQSSRDGLTRVREIVGNLRDFAHLDEAPVDNMDVVAAMESTLEVLTADMGAKSLNLQTSFDARPQIHCQPAKIKQVFHSILVNAIQASDSGGILEVGVSHDNTSVFVNVRDHGAGMDEITQQRLFDPFYTTRPVGSGQGLGLAVSYGVIKQHNGSIEFVSAVQKGTSFRVILPMTSRSA